MAGKHTKPVGTKKPKGIAPRKPTLAEAPKKPPVRKAAAPKTDKKQAARKAGAPKKPSPSKVRARTGTEATEDRKKPAKARAAGKPKGSSRRVTLDLPSFRERLLQKQKELMQAYVSTKGDSRNRQADGTEDYIDYAVSSYDREFLLSLSELERTQLNLVEEALRRLDRGEFGLCSQCGRSIPPKRLDVQPWARYCVACQELEEQGLMVESPEGFPDEDEIETVVEEDLEDDEEYEGEVDAAGDGDVDADDRLVTG
jgi:DnaK suppressor protein